jgi:hypothetical protein
MRLILSLEASTKGGTARGGYRFTLKYFFAQFLL